MQTVALIACDRGDGSTGTLFILNPADGIVERLINHDPEAYGSNDWEPKTLTFPEHLDLVACGFDFSTEEELTATF